MTKVRGTIETSVDVRLVDVIEAYLMENGVEEVFKEKDKYYVLSDNIDHPSIKTKISKEKYKFLKNLIDTAEYLYRND